jgi:hypothetical protein
MWLFMVGPFKKAPGGYTHLLITVNKFSKWIEALPITKNKSKQVMLFFCYIIHQVGVPNSIITNNDTQFMGKKFLRFCDEYHIHVDWATVAHPRTNE